MSEPAHLGPSIVTAISVLAGALLGSWLTGRREARKEAARARVEAGYLAVLVVAHLDKFADGCVAVAYDDGTCEGRPAGQYEEMHETTTKPPVFAPLELDVDWKVLPVDLMYSILNLPNRAEQLSRFLSDPGFYDPPDHSSFFWARQAGYAELGLEVSALARRLRLHAKLPVGDYAPGGYRRDEALREAKQRIENERAAHEAKLAARPRTSGI